MSVERALDGWEGVQRQGHDIADRIGSLAQGLGCLIQSHLNSSVSLSQSVISSTLPGWTSDDPAYGRFNDEHERSLPWHWPWIVKPQRRPSNRVQFNCKRNLPKDAKIGTPEVTFSISQGASELGQRLEQAGADLTACIRGFVHDIAKRFSLPFKGDAELLLVPQSLEHDAKLEFQGDYMPWREVNEASASGDKVRAATWKRLNSNRNSGADESQAQAGHVQNEIQDVSNEELFSYLNKWQGRLHRQQGSVNMTTTFNSRTQEIESSVVARGDLWRAEVSHGGNSASGSSPLFLLQVGPILFVRDTTLLLPIHLSKQHLLWYGFDRKNGLHSLCPAVWTKHRRWLLMSMICLNPLTCTFMDLQFPNGQLTYVAGEGLTSCAFIRAFGGLIQAQSRQPGDSKISFSKKMSWGTQITPSLQLPEKSFSLGVVQPLAWHRSGVMVKPRVQLSVTPTIGGRNAGWRAELSHSLREKLSWACGCALTIQPTAYVSVSLGKSLQKGGYSGSTGVIIIVETPVENLRRASVSIQLNNEVEY